jgi:hypothetical protein
MPIDTKVTIGWITGDWPGSILRRIGFDAIRMKRSGALIHSSRAARHNIPSLVPQRLLQGFVTTFNGHLVSNLSLLKRRKRYPSMIRWTRRFLHWA